MERLGPYLIDGELGRGGMGVVWRARDTRTGRAVALKTIAVSSLGADPRALERFRREAAAARRVAHPNIAGLLDLGDERGTTYLAFELVDGPSLDRVLRDRGPLPWREAARVGAAVARALAAVHAAGLVHRDVKPANVLRAADGTAKLADFGLVRAVGSKDSLAGSLTQEGCVVGTPQYFAPEQLEESRSVGPAADLYALGGTIFALLTGRPPFEGAPVELMRKHLLVAPPAPSARVEGVPRALDQLVVRLLAKQPEERGASAEVVARELDAIAEGAPAPRVGSGARLFVAALLLAAVVGGGVAAWSLARAPKPGPAAGVAPPTTSPPAPGTEPPPSSREPVLRGAFGEGAPWRHADGVDAVVLSSDGKFAFSIAGLFEKSLRKWNVADGSEVFTLRVGAPLVEGEDALALAVTPDGKVAITGARNGTVKVWDLEKRALLRGWDAHAGRILGVALVGPGAVLTAGDDGFLRVWDLKTGARTLEVSAGAPVFALAVRGDLVVTGHPHDTALRGLDEKDRVRLWRLPDLSPRGELEVPNHSSVDAIAFDPTGELLATAGWSGEVSLYRLGPVPQFLRRLDGTRIDPTPVGALVFAAANRLASGDSEGKVRLYELDAEGRETILQVARCDSSVRSLAALPGGRLLAASWDRRLHVFEKNLTEAPQDRSVVESVAALSEDAVLATGGGKDLLRIELRSTEAEFKTTGGTTAVTRLTGHGAHVIAVAAAADGFVTGDGAGELIEWSTDGKIRERSPARHAGWIAAAAFSPDGRHFATVGWDGALVVTERASRRTVKLEAAPRGAKAVAWSPTGDRLVTAAIGGRAVCWRVGDAFEPRELPRLESPMIGPAGGEDWEALAAFAPDGRIVAGMLMGTLGLFDASSLDRKPLTTEGWYFRIAWIDERRYALAHSSGRIELRELDRERPTAIIDLGHQHDHARSLSVLGRSLFVGTARGAVLRYELPR